MKVDRIIWGVLLLFVGGVLLLQNFDVINFYWTNTWRFWPVLFIMWGLKLLLNRKGKQTGSIAALAVLVLSLSVLFVQGQQKPDFKRAFIYFDDNDWDSEPTTKMMHFSQPFLADDSTKSTVLNISGGAVVYELKHSTDSLFEAHVEKGRGGFSLLKNTNDSTIVVDFKMKGRKHRGGHSWNFGPSAGIIDLRLNTYPVWDINLSTGAGSSEFDLSNFKVSKLKIEGGASSFEVKLGELYPLTKLNVETGAANVEIKIPLNSGCQIKTSTGMSSRDFSGFTKKNNGVYETSNFASAKNKIFIDLEGGLSNFEVDRY